jgi:hypothetical protein
LSEEPSSWPWASFHDEAHGAYPRDGKVRPEDLSATLFHLLGHTPSTEFLDPLGRPHPISRGEVLRAIVS